MRLVFFLFSSLEENCCYGVKVKKEKKTKKKYSLIGIMMVVFVVLVYESFVYLPKSNPHDADCPTCHNLPTSIQIGKVAAPR